MSNEQIPRVNPSKMVQKVGFRNSIPSPSSLSGSISLSEPVLRVWVRLDSESLTPDKISQATAIEYARDDTVDDLKDRIFCRFRNTRWAIENDSFGIGIGCWCECGFGSAGLAEPREQQLMHPVPNTAGATTQIDFSRAPSAIRQASRTCSPRATSLGVAGLATPLAHSPFAGKLQCHTQNCTPVAQFRLAKDASLAPAADGGALSPARLGTTRRTSRTVTPIVGETGPIMAPRGPAHQLLLEPDELVINVCKTLFGGVAAQTANDALLVFSGTREAPAFDTAVDEMPLVEDMTDYKLVVDEEQLRKLSHTNDDENPDCLKQAILLLPRGFEGDVNLPSPSLNPASPSTPEDHLASPAASHSLVQPESPLLSTAPLVEEEVGLVPSRDPVVQREDSPFLRSAMETFTTESITRDKVFPKISVLVVEDNMINQTILSSFLRKHKISYKVAKNGIEAVDRWKEGGMHLILMDLEMPLLSGIDAAKEIRRLEKLNGIGSGKPSTGEHAPAKRSTSKAPVIIVALTASNSQSDKTEALLAGCNDYLTKPVNLDWLTRKITEWGCMQALIDFDDWKENNERHNSSTDTHKKKA